MVDNQQRISMTIGMYYLYSCIVHNPQGCIQKREREIVVLDLCKKLVSS